MIVFISAPFTSNEPNGIENNIWAAREASIKLWKNGIPNICPHLNSGVLATELRDVPIGVFYQGYIQIMRHCACVLFLPQWADSVGCKKEHETAQQCAIPIYYDIHQLIDDVNNHRVYMRF